MCQFKEFYYLCGCSKYLIDTPCEHVSTNVQGEAFCPLDAHPHPEDGILRPYFINFEYGPAVCSGVACQWRLGLRAPGAFGSNSAPPPQGLEKGFDLSEEAREEREARWYRMLTTDQQLECLSITFPLPVDQMSDYARYHLNPHQDDVVGLLRAGNNAEELRWYELNPKYLGAPQLQHATGLLLPASVTAPGQERGSTPHQPSQGPFAVKAHRCRTKRRCEKCGRIRGKKAMPDPGPPGTRQHRNLDVLLNHLAEESDGRAAEWEEMMKEMSATEYEQMTKEVFKEETIFCAGGGVLRGGMENTVMADGSGMEFMGAASSDVEMADSGFDIDFESDDWLNL